MDCENCRHLTVIGLHDTGPRTAQVRRVHSVKKRKFRRNSNSRLLPQGTNTTGRACHTAGEPATLRESLPHCGRACHTAVGEPATLWESLPHCGRACHTAGEPATLPWESLPHCGRACHTAGEPATLWESLPHCCGRACHTVGEPATLWESLPHCRGPCKQWGDRCPLADATN